jgi:signal transduction histidine kinase
MLAFGRDQEPRRMPARLAQVVDGAIDLAGANGTEIVKRIEPVLVSIDPEMMQRVFLNILRNAVEAGARRIEIEGDAGGVRFTDDGPGIPPDILEKLFTPFVTGKAKGTGLGLAIAQKIVEAHGGSIEARNSPEGGATFVVKL